MKDNTQIEVKRVSKQDRTYRIEVLCEETYENRNRLTREQAQPWLDALRSGHYRQGENYLYKIVENTGAEFCCLGVACHVANPFCWQTKGGGQTKDSSKAFRPESDVTNFGQLPPLHPFFKVLRREGMFMGCEVVYLGDGYITHHSSLTELNDHPSHYFTFPILADIIEEIFVEPAC